MLRPSKGAKIPKISSGVTFLLFAASKTNWNPSRKLGRLLCCSQPPRGAESPPPPPKDVWKVYTFFSTSKRSQTPTWFFWGLYCILNDISCSWFHFCKACLIIVILKEFPTIDFIFVIHLFYFCVSWGV